MAAEGVTFDEDLDGSDVRVGIISTRSVYTYCCVYSAAREKSLMPAVRQILTVECCPTAAAAVLLNALDK